MASGGASSSVPSPGAEPSDNFRLEPADPSSSDRSRADTGSVVTPLSTLRVRERFRRKHERIRRHAHEHNKDPDWYKHEKHLLMTSWSGRPIFTLYGDESKLAAYMGVVCAIVSNFQRSNDTLRTIIAGKHKFVFLLRGPIYLVAISRTSESVAQLTAQLHMAHQQFLSQLYYAPNVIESSPSYDIRNLMSGTELLLAEVIRGFDRSPRFLLQSLPPLRLPRSTRSRIRDALKKGRTKSWLYTVLLAGEQLVSMVTNKDRSPHPNDMLLLCNFLTNSQSMRNSENWTPICLPNFSEEGFLYAYVCFLVDDVCLALVTGNNDDFHPLRECKQQIVQELEKKQLLQEIVAAAEDPTISAWGLDQVDVSCPELCHFLYKDEAHAQLLHPPPLPPFHTREQKRAMLRRYQHVHSRMQDSKGQKRHSLYFESSSSYCVLCVCKSGEFELYLTFTPLVTKEAATLAANKLLRWIKKEENHLFAF